MKIGSFALRIFLLFVAAAITPIVLLSLYVYFLGPSEGVVGDDAMNIVKSGIVFVIVLGFFLSLVCFGYINKVWQKVIMEVKRGIAAIEVGNLDHKIELPGIEELTDIENEFTAMADKLKESKRELELQALEIYAKNIEIQQANMELEASYGQLQATINQLNDSEQKYYSLVKNMTDIVCVIRLDGSIYFINEIVKDILGYYKHEVEGKNIKQLIKPDISGGFFEKVSDDLKIKNSLSLELELISKDGRTVLTETTLTNFVYDGEIIGIQAILRDVTQKKKMEQEIVSSYKELATINSLSRKLNSTLEINQVLNLVVYEISRVLKNPLCTLRLLDESTNVLIPKAYAGEYLTEAVNDISDFSIYSMNDQIYQKVFESTEPTIRRDVENSQLIKRINSNKKDKEKLKELMMAPIKIKEKKIGVLTVGITGKFNSRQKSLLSSIANNAGIAIENARLYDLSRKNFIKTVNALIAAIEAKDKYTQGHSYRVSRYAVMLAEKMGLSQEQIDEVRVAGILHDIGKIGIPDAILSKPSKLTQEEFEQIKKHPSISRRILEPVGLSEATIRAITYHHERWDGKGYPFGITSELLSIEAQIISVADALDAMTSNRAYRKAMTEEEAVSEVIKGRESQFSPTVVDALTELVKTSGIGILKEDFEQ